MPVAPVGFHNVTFVFQAAGAVRQSTFQLGIEDEGSPGYPPESVVGQCRIAFSTTGAPGAASAMSNQWSFLGCVDHYSAEGGQIIYEDLTTVAGTATSKPVPSNGAILIRKNTGLGGRRNRGRIYCPPFNMDESSVDAMGVILPANVAYIQGLWTFFLSELTGSDLAPRLFHSEAPFTPSPVTGFSVQGILGTQRRRMRK
uniref:Uncharacterized protein n=1 Tax=uncultured prokaryote TaxID=198431 RepID=A0A0H5Q5F1_9ZZZZ|nr:hypothetical protein [uncultured prokaryote]